MAKLLFTLALVCLTTGVRSQILEGLVQLDKISFDKVVTKFEYSLIKFDVGFPSGDKHKNFGKVATQVKIQRKVMDFVLLIKTLFVDF